MKTQLLLFATAMWVASAGHALCPKPTPKVCAEYFENDSVFLGTVTAKTYVSDGDWIKYTIRVKDVYRGHPGTVAHVLTENASNRWDADIGKTYLVFALAGQTSATCGPLDDPEYAQQAIRQIRGLRHASHATVEGEVLHYGPHRSLGDPAEGIRLIISGSSTRYEATTDKTGRFSIALPAGHYQLESAKLRLTVYSTSKITDDINLENGQCAQFQLVTD